MLQNIENRRCDFWSWVCKIYGVKSGVIIKFSNASRQQSGLFAGSAYWFWLMLIIVLLHRTRQHPLILWRLYVFGLKLIRRRRNRVALFTLVECLLTKEELAKSLSIPRPILSTASSPKPVEHEVSVSEFDFLFFRSALKQLEFSRTELFFQAQCVICFPCRVKDFLNLVFGLLSIPLTYALFVLRWIERMQIICFMSGWILDRKSVV